MTATAPPPTRRHTRKVVALGGVLALALAGIFTLFTAADPESASALAIDQCNGTGGGGGQTVQCDVVVVNTLTDDPLTTGSVMTINGVTTTSTDVVNSVTQCNGSAAGNGSTLLCTVNITNNIAMNGPAAPSTATVNQCNDNQSDGLGVAPNLCNPGPATTSGATITQCNDTGDGGGLVSPSSCSASGTVSASLPLLVNQCNGSANGGGGRVVCSVTITTNVVDTAVTAPDSGGGTPSGGGGSGPGAGLGAGSPGFPLSGVPPVVTDARLAG